MYEMHRNDRENEQRCILLRLETKASLRASHELQLLYEWSCTFAGKILISSLVLRTQRAVIFSTICISRQLRLVVL